MGTVTSGGAAVVVLPLISILIFREREREKERERELCMRKQRGWVCFTHLAQKQRIYIEGKADEEEGWENIV